MPSMLVELSKEDVSALAWGLADRVPCIYPLVDPMGPEESRLIALHAIAEVLGFMGPMRHVDGLVALRDSISRRKEAVLSARQAMSAWRTNGN